MTHDEDRDTELRLRGADLYWQAIDGEVVALEARGSQYVAANAAGALLWQALAEGATREALAGRLAAAYDLPPQQARRDTDAFLAQLRSTGVLEE